MYFCMIDQYGDETRESYSSQMLSLTLLFDKFDNKNVIKINE